MANNTHAIEIGSKLSRFASGMHALRFLFAMFVCSVPGTLVVAAPYPVEGLVIQWVQADGTPLTLRVFGDQQYAHTETQSGYTVLYVSADQTYYYAEPAAHAGSLVPSNVAAHEAAPVNLEKHLRSSNKGTAAVSPSEHADKVARDVSANWAVRKKAVQEARARAERDKAGAVEPLPLVQPSLPESDDTPVAEQ